MKTILNMPHEDSVSMEKLYKEFVKFLPNNTLKDLRHTFNTRIKELGVSNELTAIWCGRTVGNITADVYTHYSMEYQQKEALKVKY